MSDIDPDEARQIRIDARIEDVAANMRQRLRMVLGLGPERAPWEDENEGGA